MARSKWKPSEVEKNAVYEGAKKGLNYKELAETVGVSLATFRRNLDTFLPLIKKGREEGDPETLKQVKSALVKRAVGFEYTEQTIEKKKSALSDTGIVIMEKATKKYVVPNVAAIIFFLCNRAKEDWRNVSQVDHNISEDDAAFELMLKNATPAERKIIAKFFKVKKEDD